MRISLVPLLPLALSLAACGSSDPKADGYEAMQSGDYDGAATSFSAALDGAGASDPDFVELTVARCQALAHVDSAKASTELLAAAETSDLTSKDFGIVISELVTARQFTQAIDLLDAGMKRFPDDKKMEAMKDKVVAEAQKGGDPDDLEKLKGLGYL